MNFDYLLRNEHAYRKALFANANRLDSILPYQEYLSDHQVFLLKDGSLGAMFEVSLMEHESQNIEDLQVLIQKLTTWFSGSESEVMQILFEQSELRPDDPLWIKEILKYPESHPVSQKLYSERLQHLKQQPLFKRSLYLTIRSFENLHTPKSLSAQVEQFSSQLVAFDQKLKTLEQSSPLQLKRCTHHELISILRRWFQPNSHLKFPEIEKQELSSQILFSTPTLSTSGLERDSLKSQTFSWQKAPMVSFTGAMTQVLKLPFAFKVCLNISFPPKLQTKRWLDLKEFFLENTPSARARRQKQDVMRVQEKLAYDDECVSVTATLTYDGHSNEDLIEKKRQVFHLFHSSVRIPLMEEPHIGLGLWLNTLPLNYIPKTDFSSQRALRMLRSDLVYFLPIFTSFQGLQEGGLQLYLSRENNLVPFSLLSNETSNHTVVLADTGSGKSAFIIDCIQAAKKMNPEPLVFVVDKKSSYQILSHYYNAHLTKFDHQVAFSPFRGEFDEDKVRFLTYLLTSAAEQLSKNFQIQSDHRTAITKALLLAHEQAIHLHGLQFQEGNLVRQTTTKPVEVTMDLFMAELASLPSHKDCEKFRKASSDLLTHLAPLHQDGNYAKFFQSSQSNTEASNLFYIYDLDALDGDPILQSLMTMSVFEEIRQTIKKNPGRMGFIVMEEFAMIGRNNPTAKAFILDFAETCRKLGVWLIALTPRPQNFFELDIGQALWGVADNFLFLRMASDNIRYLKEHSELLSPAHIDILSSLKTHKNKYADIFFVNKSKTQQGVLRFIQTPLDRWLAPTNAEDFHKAMTALKTYEPWKALEVLTSQERILYVEQKGNHADTASKQSQLCPKL